MKKRLIEEERMDEQGKARANDDGKTEQDAAGAAFEHERA